MVECSLLPTDLLSPNGFKVDALLKCVMLRKNGEQALLKDSVIALGQTFFLWDKWVNLDFRDHCLHVGGDIWVGLLEW